MRLAPLLSSALQFRSSSRTIVIAKDEVQAGLSVFEDVMVWQDGADLKAWDRTCDHAGGRLISTSGAGVMCPLHGWCFDPSTGRYDNGRATKQPLALTDAGEAWTVSIETRIPELSGSDDALPVTVRYLNHACLLIEGGGVRFATDPWLFGSAFCDGWWLLAESPVDALEALNSCDFLFISHNHPDHLHPETLSRVRRDMPMLTADFASGSTARYLRDLGFSDVRPLAFGQAYRHPDKPFALAALKSGDFRDDSGLYFRIGAFTGLLTVDANFLNFGALPHATLLASSFAGGASGFPLCFDDYSVEEKLRLLARNRGAVRTAVSTTLRTARPGAFIPYAGFFAEDPTRDTYIAALNAKNTIDEYAGLCGRLGTHLVDVQKTPVVRFTGQTLTTCERSPSPPGPPTDRVSVLATSAATWADIPDGEVIGYFAASGFQANFVLNIAVTEDDLSPAGDLFEVDFRGPTPVARRIGALPDPKVRHATTGAQVTNARIRRPAFVRTLREGLPWEDLSIGFQARFTRAPNQYEADFWYHFTNVHISERARRSAADCGQACQKLDAVLV